MAAAQILIVEDESIVAKGIETELRSMGYGVSGVASSGEEALRKVAETIPDLVLMDVVLKGDMDGVETTQELQECFDIPVVYLTAYADDWTLKRAKVTEPYGYLVKPYEEKELRTTIEVALHKHQLRAIEKEMQRWRATILRSIGDAVIVTDSGGCIRLTNRVAEKLTGWSDEDAFGEDLVTVVRLVDERTRTALELPMAEALSFGGIIPVEERSLLIARDGKEIPVEGTFAPIENDSGGFGGCVVVLRDITERRQATEALQRREKQLRWLQKMESLGRLAGGMARDFSQVLTTISAELSGFLARLPENHPNREQLMTTEKVAREAAEVIKHLLASTRRAVPQPETVNFNALIQSMMDPLRRAIDPRVAIEFKPASDLWTVQADPTQMNEIIMTLCLNAQDAMPGGGQLLLETENVVMEDTLSTLSEFRLGEFVRFRVSDTGRGIPSTIKAHVYEPLFTTKELGNGTALGLALIFAIVEQHCGWIDCYNEGNEGTHFEVYLPRYRSDDVSQEG